MSKKICAITTVEVTQRHFVIPAMRRLKENGWDITIMCNMSEGFIKEFGQEFRLINIPFHRGISFSDILTMPLKLYKLFLKEQFDLIQYATPNASLYTSIASRLAHTKHRVYCQWGIRYVGSSGIMRSILKGIEKATCSLSTTIRAASRKNLEFAVTEGLYHEDKASVIGNGGSIGIDLKQFDISKKDSYRTQVEEEFPKLKNKIVFSFIGRINTDKGFFELLSAYESLKKEIPEAALLLIGEFEEGFLENSPNLKEEDNIIVTGWTNEVPKYISASDVLVHPSHREGFSMVIQQAMAMGIPVITTDIPGPSEVIENKVTGLLIPPKEADSLCQAMIWMAQNKQERQKMGVAGFTRCQQLFSRERMLNLTLQDRENILKSN